MKLSRPELPPNDETQPLDDESNDQQVAAGEIRINKEFIITFSILLGILILISPFLLIGIGLFFFIFGGIFDYLFLGIWYFVTGWMYSPLLFFGVIQTHPFACVVGLLALIVLPVVLHQLVIRVFLKGGKTWQFRQSVAIVGILCSFVIMAVSMMAVIQEYSMLAHPSENLTERRWALGKRIDDHGNPVDDQPTKSTSATEVTP